MRTNALWLAAVVALLSAACTKVNREYCADAGAKLGYSCSRLAEARDAASSDAQDAPQEATDADEAGEAGDTNTDATTDVAEAKPAPICSADDQCAAKDAGTAACDTTDGGARCVECTMNPHCPGSKPVCSAEKCVECTGDNPTIECKATGLGVCNKAKSTCVQCVDSSTCANPSPVCETTTNTCRPCKADSECKTGPGICVDWDGHCATADEVVTLQGGTGCVASGTSVCKSSDAVVALATPSRSVLLVKGPAAVGMIEPGAGVSQKLLIVGQGSALVSAGASDVASVHLSGPNRCWVRNLTISGGTVGILADGGAEIHLSRCVVTRNDMGGIKVTDTNIDITNMIVAANGVGTDTGGLAWGGVRLGDISGGAGRFENNTVVDNLSIGVSCKNPYDTSTNIVHGNQGGDTVNCSGAPCCGSSNPAPMLDANYRLMAGSMCIDKIDATTTSVTVDIDGQPRPAPPGKLDCGADEFQ